MKIVNPNGSTRVKLFVRIFLVILSIDFLWMTKRRPTMKKHHLALQHLQLKGKISKVLRSMFRRVISAKNG